MKIIILGPPGAGKGTQAEFIAEKFNIPKISTGDMLREAIAKKSELGLQAKAIMDQGGYVSDNLIMQLVVARLSEEDCKSGYLLDGFPRTQAQIEGMEKNNIDVEFVIEIKVPAESIIKRLSGRRVHVGSGRVYHIHNKPPKKEGFDDETGEPLIQRDDDKPDTIKARLDVYEKQTQVLTEIYKEKEINRQVKYIEINGDQDMSKVREDINSNLPTGKKQAHF